MPDIDNDTPEGKRKRSRKRGPLQLEEKIDIMQRILISFESHKDVAKVYRVSTGVVGQVVHKVKQNPKLMAELHPRRQAQLDRMETVSAVLDDLNGRNTIIDRAS